MKEAWKDVDGYEGIYQVSNLGRIRTFRVKDGYVGFKLSDTPKLMSLIPNGNGYLYVTFVKDGKRSNHYVHRTVAQAFIGKIPKGYVINHIDYDKTNNHVENLEIVTQKKNVQHSIDRMRKPRARTGDYYIRYREKNRSYEVTVKLKTVGSFKTIEEARKARDEYIEKINYY